jgi:hypothetical protein
MSDASKIGTLVPKTTPLRRSSRTAIDMQVQVFTPKMTCCGRGHELGLLGMAIHVPLELTVGETIRLMFQPPGSKIRFGLFGIVRNRDGFRFGVEFLELRKAEREELERVVGLLTPVVAAS